MSSPVHSSNTLALLLPGYSPGLAWLARALQADRVILDDLHPFSRKSRVHRAKIRTPDGHQWLTIPLVREDHRKPVCETRIDHKQSWLSSHLRALEYNYRNSLYFDYYEPEIRADLEYAKTTEYLIDFILHMMKRQWIYLQLKVLTERTSHLYENNAADSIIDNYSLIKNSSPVTVWQEPESRHYQKPLPEATEPVFTHPVYRQHFEGFVEGCSLLDLLFEYGPDAWKVLDILKLDLQGQSDTR